MIELVIVMIVAVILMAIAIPTFRSQQSIGRQHAMRSAAELVAGGISRFNGDFPPVNASSFGDPLTNTTRATALRRDICPVNNSNPVCRSTDRLLFTTSGAPAITSWPDSPYGGEVTLVRGNCAAASPPGTVKVCRLGRDGFEVTAWGTSTNGSTIRVWRGVFA